MQNEMTRPTASRHQILAAEHSRMGLLPRVANEVASPDCHTFASIALGGITPRCWFYELRTVDPTSSRYDAILIPDDYEEPDEYDYVGDREADLHYLIRRLELRDLITFPLSYDKPRLAWDAFLGILLKGFVYRLDFQAFLTHPRLRLERVRFYSNESAGWYYGFNGDSFSLAGLSVDWETKAISFPSSLNERQRSLIRGTLFKEHPPYTGRSTAYFSKWYGRIVERYKDSRTKVIFMRVPRGPLVRPGGTPVNVRSAVRKLASQVFCVAIGPPMEYSRYCAADLQSAAINTRPPVQTPELRLQIVNYGEQPGQ